MISRRSFLTLSAAAAASGATGVADAFAIEPGFRLVVKEWTVASADWPTGAKPLKIGILTDIHAVEPWMPARRVGAIAERLNELRPDVIVLLGDYVNALRPRFYAAPVAVADWAAALKPLSAPLGVYAVLGNHDWWSGEVPAIRRAFDKVGIHLLENHAVKLRRAGDQFWIAGLGDQLAYNSHGVDDVNGTLARVTDGSPVILLAHEPDIFASLPSRVALTLSGHTHGGQVYIPFVGRPALDRNYVGRNSGFAYGLYEKKGRHLIVSSGLGLSNYPIRFMVPPEIAMVTLRGIDT